jgi:hypothetical protein
VVGLHPRKHPRRDYLRFVVDNMLSASQSIQRAIQNPHALDVVERVTNAGLDLRFQIVAALHDEIEDGRMSAAEVLHLFPPEIAQAVIAITRLPSETYFDGYLPRVKANPIAAPVKRHDLRANLDRSVNDASRASLRQRWQKALEFLS